MMPLRPNYRRAREIRDELEQLASEYEDAWVAGRFDVAESAKADMDELRHELFLTGVTSEDDQ